MTNKWVAETQLAVLEICLAYRKKDYFQFLLKMGELLGGESTYWNWVLRSFIINLIMKDLFITYSWVLLYLVAPLIAAALSSIDAEGPVLKCSVSRLFKTITNVIDKSAQTPRIK